MTVEEPMPVAGPAGPWIARPREPAAGDCLGRYVVEAVLGRGGMGTVYAARDPGLDRKVAVKLLHATVEEQRLVREAKALAKLAHPNVVAVYDVGAFEQRTFVAMELVDGWTVRDWLAAAPRTWRDILAVYTDAARGLGAAHDAGLVHRDFKPDNVLVGRDGRARVVDFGLVSRAEPGAEEEEALRAGGAVADDAVSGANGAAADGDAPSPSDAAPHDAAQSVNAPATLRGAAQAPHGVAARDAPPAHTPNTPSAPTDLRLTETGVVMGTPAYLAAEQFRSAPADARSDQFAFAVSLWESLFGERPFRGRTFAGLMISVTNGDLTEPAKANAAPRWLYRILRRALSTDPAARYPSMDALLTDLRHGAESAAARVPLAGGRYEPIDAPGDGVRAQRLLDRLTNQVVTLQPVVTDQFGDSVDTKLALSRDFMKLMALDHPHIVKVLDFGVGADARPFVVLDAAAQADGLTEIARRSPQAITRSLLAQLLGALGYLHRRDLVHGDLSPAHLRVAQGQLKLVVLGDASLPSPRSPGMSSISAVASEPRLEPAREPGLLAPEVRRGEAATPASDLWTFGTIARQVLQDVDAPLSEVLDRLTAREARDRYPNAREAADAWGRATNTNSVLDTVETRESFLQSARFVGRERELAQLHGALLSAASGHGSAWLVGGESGVGKSRLVAELRARAHAAGALVVRGQAEPTGGPYAAWCEVLRGLLVVSDVPPFDASVLLPLVPELPRLLGGAISPAPELDGPATQARLRQVVLRTLLRQARPVVIILEDLHWAESGTLDLLRALLLHVPQLPLLLLATYRSEDRPSLPESLPGTRSILLDRLDTASVAALAAAMLGAERTSSALVELLTRESEGNAFFVVEIVRALAEQAGSVDAVAELELPERVLVGGVRRVLRRRLERMPADTIEALVRCAAIGRRIDEALLDHLMPELDRAAWIRTAIDAAVLERTGREAQFAHDKLREEILADLDTDARRKVHADVAGAIEAVYGEAPERAIALAFHHREAGHAPAEVHYTRVAGEFALAQGAHHEATGLLERAVALLPETPSAARAQLLYQLGSAYFFQMDFERAQAVLRASAAAAGVYIPARGFGRSLFTLRQLAVQVLHRVRPPSLEGDRRAGLLAASRAAARLSNALIFENDEIGLLGTSLLAVNLADRTGVANGLSLALLGFAAGAVGLSDTADAYFARMRDGSDDDGEARGLASGMVVEATAYLGRGRLDLAERTAADALTLCERTGDRLNQSYVAYVLGILAYYRGTLEDALHLLSSAQNQLDPADARHGAVGFASWEIHVACTLGRLQHAESRLAATRASFGAHDRLSEGIWHGVHAQVLARRGDLDAARDAVREALRCVPNSRSAAPTGGGLIAGVVETALAVLAKQSSSGISASDAEPRMRHALRYARQWAASYPLGRPALLAYRAQHATILGRAERAHGLLAESARVAHAQGNALGEITATAAAARTLGPGSGVLVHAWAGDDARARASSSK